MCSFCCLEKPAIARSTRPTAGACARWSLIAAYDNSLGIVTVLSLRAGAHTGVAIRSPNEKSLNPRQRDGFQ